ncbi:phosphatidylserine/phosphatidylglycerophosphate/cardiolipin synthase family protein [Flavihumibacter stibioxidans]|nr:phospholipase D-like domain-containing protein [Flavihumibacter stibioxidans]
MYYITTIMAGTFPTEGYFIHNRVQLIRGGKQYFDSLVNLINGAKSSIHLQMYIVDDDETGMNIIGALMNAAGRGVQVFMLLDGYASQVLSRKVVKQIIDSGIRFRWFEPLFRSPYFYFGRRLHHKVIVVDACRSLVGGVNISDRYNDTPGSDAWLDWAVLAEGEVAGRLFLICQDLWNKSGWGKKKTEKYKLQPALTEPPENSCLVRVRRQDWVRRRIEISASYLEMMENAREEILMMSSYFLPGRQLRRSMAAASKRGVRIRMIAAGKSDVMLAKNAERYLYRWLLKNRVELYEYQASILHGKISCADGKWATVGSFNINFISAYASIELNLDVLDDDFSCTVQNELEEIISHHCIPITEQEWSQHYNLFQRAWQKFSYDLIRLIFFLFTFYFKQRR